MSCVFTEEIRVFCVRKLLWFEFTYESQPKCWSQDGSHHALDQIEFCVCVRVIVTTPDDISVLVGAVEAIVPHPLCGLLTVMATLPWPRSLNGSVYDMMSPV